MREACSPSPPLGLVSPPRAPKDTIAATRQGNGHHTCVRCHTDPGKDVGGSLCPPLGSPPSGGWPRLMNLIQRRSAVFQLNYTGRVIFRTGGRVSEKSQAPEKLQNC